MMNSLFFTYKNRRIPFAVLIITFLIVIFYFQKNPFTRFNTDIELKRKPANTLIELHEKHEKSDASRNSISELTRITKNHNTIKFFENQNSFIPSDVIKMFIGTLIMFSIGIWIENCFGLLFTFLIFFYGLIVGQSTLYILNNDLSTHTFIFGQFAFLGAYCSLLGRRELRFIFLLTPIKISKNFKLFQLTAPLTFIIFEFSLYESDTNFNEMHLANFFSFLFGVISGFYLMNKIPLNKHSLSPTEDLFLNSIEKDCNSITFLKKFKSIMKWNPQNLQAIKLFLNRLQYHPSILKKEANRFWLEKIIAFAIRDLLQNGSFRDKIEWLMIIPDELELDVCLQELTIDEIINLSSQCIEQNNFSLAKKLLLSALEKTPNATQENSIHQSIHNLNSLFRGYLKAS